MHLRSLRLATFLVLGSAACVTAGGFRKQAESWLGADINQAIMQLGPPSNTYTLPNGTQMYSWLWVGNTVVSTNYNQYLNMVTTSAGTYWCQLSYTASTSGRIEAWQARGNACRARNP